MKIKIYVLLLFVKKIVFLSEIFLKSVINLFKTKY